MTGEKMTFIELLNKYKKVVIPKIQRDYAQGRTNFHSNAVRKKLLEDIYKTLSEKSHLDLNFVYGSVEGDSFIPIDGQQRLTTLFLLHLYAFKDADDKTYLKNRFTYETRVSSSRFIEYIIDNRSKFFKTNQEYPKPSDLILDSSDYISSYDCDPTVKSILQMLDDIDAKFKDMDNLDTLLTENYITFKFLKIDNLGSADDLYIKLNARGKPLTDFENFKAKLMGVIRDFNQQESCIPSDFEGLFDSKWTDFFWERGKEKCEKEKCEKVEYEKEFYTLFKILLFNYELVEQDSTLNDLLQALDKGDKATVKNMILSAYYLLNFLCDKNNKETDAYKLIIKALENPTAINHLAFHTISVFLLKQNGMTARIKDWARVFRNLINNNIKIDRFKDSSKPNAAKAIKEINDFSKNIKHLTNILNNIPENSKTLSCFESDQLKEEREKAKIIIWSRSNDNSVFENEIYEAEKLEYFGGQIRVGLYPAKDGNSSCGYDLQKFKARWEKVKFLFGDYDYSKNELPDDILLRQALLSIGDYTPEISVYKTLCSVHTDTNEVKSLKSLFSSDSDDPNGIARILLNNLNTILTKEAALQNIIDNNIHNVKQTDWRYCFINYDKLFDYFISYYYRIKEATFIYPTKRILIVPRLSSSGNNVDIFLGALKEELKQRGRKVSLAHEVYTNCRKGTDGDYFIVCSQHQITYDCLKNVYLLCDNNWTPIFTTKTNKPITEMADYLITNNLI